MNDNSSVYLDTSVLAKWYLLESNSEQVAEYIISLNQAADKLFAQAAKAIGFKVDEILKLKSPQQTVGVICWGRSASLSSMRGAPVLQLYKSDWRVDESY